MNNFYISLGSQCTTPKLFEKLDVKKETLPFDWMFSTPEFVYKIIKMLLIDNLAIDNIVNEHFFKVDSRVKFKKVEYYYTDNNGTVPANSKYKVIFPHDYSHEKDKYIRRLQRLKDIISDKNNFLYFFYISVSSKDLGNYVLDDKEPIQDLYIHINNINECLKTFRNNFKILVFDTSKPIHLLSQQENIILFEIEKKNHHDELLPELLSKCVKLLENNIIKK